MSAVVSEPMVAAVKEQEALARLQLAFGEYHRASHSTTAAKAIANAVADYVEATR